MPDTPREPRHLPPGLTATVGVVEEILGQVVAEAGGEALYDAVEGVRREMVAFREAEGDAGREAALDRAADRLGGGNATCRLPTWRSRQIRWVGWDGPRRWPAQARSWLPHLAHYLAGTVQ